MAEIGIFEEMGWCFALYRQNVLTKKNFERDVARSRMGLSKAEERIKKSKVDWP